MNNLNSLYVDSQSIIKSVKTRIPLWDKNHISHKDPDVLESLWNEVSTEVNLPKELLKAKWKGLRDTFRKEFKKSRSSRWIHYKSLIFLEDNMVTDKTVNLDPNSDNQNSNGSTCEKPFDEKNVNDSSSVKEESINLDDNLNYDDEETRSFTATDILKTEIDHLESENADAPNIKFTGISSECTDSVGAEFNPNLGKTFPNLTNFVCNNENIVQGIDDDFHFFMSLIPHIKPLPLDKKLELRMKMQQIIYNEMTSPN